MTEPALNGHVCLNNTAFSCRFVEIYDHSVEIWTHLLKKSLMGEFIFCVMLWSDISFMEWMYQYTDDNIIQKVDI